MTTNTTASPITYAMTWGHTMHDAIAKEPELTYDYENWIEDFMDANDIDELIDGPIECDGYLVWHHDLGVIVARPV